MHRYFALLALPLAPYFAAVFLGMLVHAWRVPVRTHVLLSFLLVIYLLGIHVMAIFMLVGSGAALRDAAAGKDWAGPYVDATRALKRRILPLAALAMICGVAAAWIGGAVHTGGLPVWAHRSAAILATGVNLGVLWVEYRALRENSRLLAEASGRLDATACSADPHPPSP
ncbi:MAG: hypothetical protein HYY93_04815 [Planctomycetes bacterium]|nr:hypothetical protein [Planctomycetota bacterium]